MLKTISYRGTKFFGATLVSLIVMFTGTIPAWATDEDVTKEVVAMKTQHEWFYWPGWAFVGLLVAIIGLVIFAWLKFVIFPKYRGRKVVQ